MRAASAALAATLLACSSAGPSPSAEPELRAQQLAAPSVRRLSTAELSAAARALTGVEIELDGALPPDARQHDFSRNLAQSVDALTLTQLDAAARDLAEALTLTAPALPTCARAAAPNDARCRDETVSRLAERGLRRPASEAELQALGALFDAGADEGSFIDGARLVVRALLGSPQLLYDTALGATPSDVSPRPPTPGKLQLTDDELASQLAWLMSGAPPDAELRAAAAAGQLRSGPARRKHAERLASAPSSRPLYRRFVEEWLGLNRLRSLAKSTAISPDFSALREPMLRETAAVVDDALAQSGGSFVALFAGGYSHVPRELSELYGIEAPTSEQRVGLSQLGRVGVLQHASFLATFAHEAESAPVLRGKAVLERLLCRNLPSPAELGIDLVLPEPNPNATTRERFELHAASDRCASCHVALDGVGFSFENFDAVGRFRDREAGRPIDTSGRVLIDERELTLTDSVDLARALATSSDLSRCAARHVARFAAGSEFPALEDDFVTATRALPAAERESILGLLLAWVEGAWFASRSTP